MGKQSRSNIPQNTETWQYRNVPLHSFAVRKGTQHPSSVGTEICQKTRQRAKEGDLSNFEIGFDVFKYTKNELYGLVYGLFQRIGLIEFINGDENEFLAFLIDIDRGYFDNPYHNFHHCVDVFYIVYFGIDSFGAARYLKKIDILGILIGALCHDIAHPGVNNLYHVNARTKLAVLYNDMSVLESYSCSQTFNLINKHSFFRNLSKSDYNITRATIVKGIMATDMGFHFDLLEKLSNFTKKFDRNKEELELESRRLIMNSILHAADISNPSRPWELSKKWSDFVVEEFFLQGDLEKLNSLPMSPNMDREVSNQASISIGFIDFIVKPFFEALCELFPKFQTYLNYLNENRKTWQAIKDDQEKKKDKEGTVFEMRTREPLPGTGRRLSVAAGTITIPSDVVARLSKQSIDGESLFSKSKESNVSDNEVKKKASHPKEDDRLKSHLYTTLKFTQEEINVIKSNDLPQHQRKSIDKVVLLLELSTVLIEAEKEICINPSKRSKLLNILCTSISSFIAKSFDSIYVRIYLADEERADILTSPSGYVRDGDGNVKKETNDENLISVLHNNESILQKVVEENIEYPFVLVSPMCLMTAPQKIIGVLEIRRDSVIFSDEEIKVIGQICNMISPKLYASSLEERREIANR